MDVNSAYYSSTAFWHESEIFRNPVIFYTYSSFELQSVNGGGEEGIRFFWGGGGCTIRRVFFLCDSRSVRFGILSAFVDCTDKIIQIPRNAGCQCKPDIQIWAHRTAGLSVFEGGSVSCQSWSSLLEIKANWSNMCRNKARNMVLWCWNRNHYLQ